MNEEQTKYHSLNLDESLNSILTNNQSFISDENNVYKSCRNEWIVIMKKLHDTITNESRKNLVDPDHAKFRANKLLILKILNKINCHETREMIESDYDWTFIYRVGKIVTVDNFDKFPELECSTGIHYYKKIEPAFHHGIKYIHGVLTNGIHKEWYSNGNKWIFENIENNSGTYTIWDSAGKLASEGHIKNGNRHGMVTHWHINGKKLAEETYVDGLHHGETKEWYENGKPRSQCYYLNGQKDGIEISWSIDGVKMISEYELGTQKYLPRILKNENF